MATGQIKSQNEMTIKAVSHVKGNIINASETELYYVYNPITMDGFIVGHIVTNGALSPGTAINFIQITDSLQPFIPSLRWNEIPITLYNVNQSKLHRGRINNTLQLQFYDSVSVSGACAFDVYIPVHLVNT